MLTDILTKDVVRLDVEGLTTPEEVIHFSGQLLVNSGKVKETYIVKMEEAFHDLGPYMVMAPGIAMPHARPSGDVSEPCISFIRLKDPVSFHHPFNDPVKLVFTLGGVENDSHLALLQELGRFLEDDKVRERLLTITSYVELEKLTEKESL